MAEKTRTETLIALKAHYKTVKATAEAMGVSKTTVRRWLRDGVPDHSELWPRSSLKNDTWGQVLSNLLGRDPDNKSEDTSHIPDTKHHHSLGCCNALIHPSEPKR